MHDYYLYIDVYFMIISLQMAITNISSKKHSALMQSTIMSTQKH